MTENRFDEAIYWLNEAMEYGEERHNAPYEEAIQALEEIQAYRAIGTVEDLKSMKENGAFTGVELASIACMQMKLKDYQSIGTIDEFKALKEKSADIEKIIESIKQLPTQDFMGVLHIPRTATINRIKRGGNCELPEV